MLRPLWANYASSVTDPADQNKRNRWENEVYYGYYVIDFTLWVPGTAALYYYNPDMPPPWDQIITHFADSDPWDPIIVHEDETPLVRSTNNQIQGEASDGTAATGRYASYDWSEFAFGINHTLAVSSTDQTDVTTNGRTYVVYFTEPWAAHLFQQWEQAGA